MEWITDKNPEVEDDYIVTIDGSKESTSLLWNGEEWLDEVQNPYRVIAWQPFPPGYKKK
jgi:hypothetical protein